MNEGGGGVQGLPQQFAASSVAATFVFQANAGLTKTFAKLVGKGSA